MSNTFSISSIRGTVFMPRIPFNGATVSDLLQHFQGYFPCFYGSPFLDNGIFFNPGDWELKAADSSVRVVFQNQKVDYIENVKSDYSQEVISAFASKCSAFFSEILRSKGQLSPRLAIAPSFLCQQPFSESKGILASFFADSKISFDNNEVDNCEFSQLFRPVKQIAGKEVKLNFLSKFSTETVITEINGVASQNQRIKADFDINTLPVNGLSFSIVAVQNFFGNAANFCEDLYKFYFQNQ